MKLPSWSEIITVIKQLQSKEIGFFVIPLWWIMYVPLSWLLSITALHGSFIFLLIPPAVNRGFSKDFGKKAPSAMPSTPGGSSKVVPIASLNPYQSKWVCFPGSGKCHASLGTTSRKKNYKKKQKTIASTAVCVILAVMFSEKPKKEPLWSSLFHCSTLQHQQHRSFLLPQLNSTGLSHMWICQTQVLLIKWLTTTFCWRAPVQGSCCWLPGMPKCNWANFNVISYTCAFLSHEELKMSVKSLFQRREVNSPLTQRSCNTAAMETIPPPLFIYT